MEQVKVKPKKKTRVKLKTDSIEEKLMEIAKPESCEENEEKEEKPVATPSDVVIIDAVEMPEKIETAIPKMKTESTESPSAPSAPSASHASYAQLSEMVGRLRTAEMDEVVLPKPKIVQIEKVAPFTFEQIESVFGSAEKMATMRQQAALFDAYNTNAPSPVHPLYEALGLYQRARSQMLANRDRIEQLAADCEARRGEAWLLRSRTAASSGKCDDDQLVSRSHRYTEATLNKGTLTDLQKDMRTLREAATEIHSAHSHSEYLLKMQVDDLLWTAIVTGRDLMMDGLNVLFFVIRSSGWGFDKHLRLQLRTWCCLLAENFLQRENNSLDSMLFVLHHILRVPQGVRWARHLIQCHINEHGDIYKAFCLLEAILILSGASNGQETSNNSKNDIDEAELVVAAVEAKDDDNSWLVVDSEGEGADIETNTTGAHKRTNTLKENDLIGLLWQICFEKFFKQLLIIKEVNNEMVFCGGNLGGGSVLKIFSSTRVFLHIVRAALLLYKSYFELAKELCRLALHSVMYCTDLWEIASLQCEENLRERLSVEYDNLVLAGISTLQCAGSREISTMFISDLPFSLCRNEVALNIFSDLCKHLIVSDSIWCYYTLVTISNIAIARQEEDLRRSAIAKLFEIGFCSDFVDLGCGEWARNLCGVTLYAIPNLIGPVLKEVPPSIPEKWLDALPLSSWRPIDVDELLSVLNDWKLDKYPLLPHLLKSLDYNPDSGLNLHMQRSIGFFLSNLAIKPPDTLNLNKTDRNKVSTSEWIWKCLILLKLHHFDWKLDPSTVPQPEDVAAYSVFVNPSETCRISSTMLILSTAWGSSLPSIFQRAAPVLLKMINVDGRFIEAIHILYYIIPCVAAQSPDSIGQNKIFKDVLAAIIKDEKSWQKMAARIVTRDFCGPHIKSLVEVIKMQLCGCQRFSMTSPLPLMSVWIHWITSLDNWQADWVAIYLIDTVLSCCFFHHDAMTEASRILQTFIQSPTPAKSPVSTSSIGSWLWNSSSSYKGLVQCTTIDAPFLWHLAFWMEHITVERGSGLWQRLIEKLSTHKDAAGKVNIDRTLKSVGGSDSSAGLVIYRCIHCATSMPLNHPLFSLIWQLFFYLYLDISFLFSAAYRPKPIGPLFFRGVINSKILAKARARLMEAKSYHETKAAAVSDEDAVNVDGADKESQTKIIQEKKAYHLNQTELMKTFHSWLDESFFNDFDNISTDHQSAKLNMLMSGQNVTWIETIDMYEYSQMMKLPKNSDSKDSPKHGRGKVSNLSADQRIIQRIITYESPLVKPSFKGNDLSLSPIIDSRTIGDFYNIHKILKLNLNELCLLSKKYCDMCQNMQTIDESLCDLIPKLYKKKQFCVTSRETCGAQCKGSAKITITGFESILSKTINGNIDSNRVTQRMVLNKALEPYKQVSFHTAVISKLSQMICSGSISLENDEGAKIFLLILEHLKDENLQFPPVNDTFNTVASQLGEKFVRSSGIQCSKLISQMKHHTGNEALICSLLRPLELPINEMLDVYKCVNESVADSHVAFSCISKFRISNWLRDARPTVDDRAKLMAHICDALASKGCSPSSDALMLQELLCVHFGHILAWEFPVHLNQALSHFHTLSLEKRLPPDCWEHCFAIYEKYPQAVSHRQAHENVEMFSCNWWSRRGTWGLHGLYEQYSLYSQAMARLGALLISTILSAAMVQQPLLLTHQIAAVVFNSMCTFWNVWLVPRWDSSSRPMGAVGVDFSRSPPLMPWGPDDNAAPDVMLDAFVETLAYCAETLPGSGDDFLRLTWQWYATSYPNSAVGAHILTRVHRALLKLPWSASTPNCTHWITYSELQTISHVCNLPLPSCHNFVRHCLGNRMWQKWIYEMPTQLQPNALHLLLPLLIKLKPEQNIFDDALQLPWGLIKVKHFEETLAWYMNTYNTPTDPFFSYDHFALICTAGGLMLKCESSIDWQSKRTSLVREWVNSLLSIMEMPAGNSSAQKSNIAEVGESIGTLLDKIETTAVNLFNCSEEEKILQSTNLLNIAIMMLNMDSLQEIACKKWMDWIAKASKISLSSMISCILSLTRKDSFASIAEQTLLLYFNKMGEWSFILNSWRNNCFVPVNFLIENNCFLAAFATYKSADMDKYEGCSFERLDKHIIYTLLNIEPNSTYENQIIIWILFMNSLIFNPSLNKSDREMAFGQVAAILEKWSEEPGIWQTYVKNVAPSPKFRIITKYARCTLSYAFENNLNAGDGPSKKFYVNLENMVDQKQYSGVKHIISEYLIYLRDKNNFGNQSLLIKLAELCTRLYSDSYYLVKVIDVIISKS